MTDSALNSAEMASTTSSSEANFGIRRRRSAETRFKLYGQMAILIAVFFLALLLWSIFSKGVYAFWQTQIKLPVTVTAELVDPDGLRNGDDPKAFRDQMYRASGKLKRVVNDAILASTGANAEEKSEVRFATSLLSRNAAFQLRDIVLANPAMIGATTDVWLYAQGDVDALMKGEISRDVPNARRQIKDRQIEMLETLERSGQLEMRWNSGIFTQTASSYSENSGLSVAIFGSAMMMLIVLALALPIGVAASIYLEEFAPKNRVTDLIEVNINNLAAVPSIVFGILGLAVFIDYIGMPRSAPVVGGLVLTLMTLPTIIIATRASLKAVPPSVREAALGVGASKMQSVFHHVLPLAMPGILTGTIIGLAQALGETAPLLMVGMDAFVTTFPESPFEPSTSLPSEIYRWSRESERAFVTRTSGAIMVLLGVLAVMNILAVILRKRFERRW